jgi:hypothetical protein
MKKGSWRIYTSNRNILPFYDDLKDYFAIFRNYVNWRYFNSQELQDTVIFATSRIEYNSQTFETFEITLNPNYISNYSEAIRYMGSFNGIYELHWGVDKVIRLFEPTVQKTIGFYIPQTNTLLLGNWLYSELCFEVYKTFADILKNNFFRKIEIKPITILLGMDPELEVYCGNKGYLKATEILPFSGHIGTDGSGCQVELRPFPSSDINELVQNVKDLLLRFHRNFPAYSLTVAGDKYPLGGHIHFNLPLDKDFIKILDNFLGQWLLPLSGKARGHYKCLSNVEGKYYGFEYRSLPSAILLTPEILTAVLKISKKIAYEFYIGDGVDEFSELEIQRLSLEKEYQTIFNFMKNYNKMNKNILFHWGIISDEDLENLISIVFRDDWDPNVCDYAYKYLKRRLKEMKFEGEVILFGLKEDRGEVVYGFDSSYYDRIPNNAFNFTHNYIFGLPYHLRTQLNLDVRENIEKLNNILEEIIKEIKRR